MIRETSNTRNNHAVELVGSWCQRHVFAAIALRKHGLSDGA
jgi:hypothetical protein